MNKDKQIDEMAQIIALKAFEQAHLIDGDEDLADIVATDLYEKGYRKASEVARTFRKRMNEKMGKHTHLLGKEYVQRIMREVEKELIGEEDA